MIVGEMGICRTGVGKMGIGETRTHQVNVPIRRTDAHVILDQLANLHFRYTSVPRCTSMTD